MKVIKNQNTNAVQLLATRVLSVTCVGVIFLCASASADSIHLRDGRHLQGKYIGGSTTTIGFMTNHSVEYFLTADVLALIFENNSGNNPQPAPNSLQPNREQDGSQGYGIQGILGPANSQTKRRREPLTIKVEEENAIFRYQID